MWRSMFATSGGSTTMEITVRLVVTPALSPSDPVSAASPLIEASRRDVYALAPPSRGPVEWVVPTSTASPWPVVLYHERMVRLH